MKNRIHISYTVKVELTEAEARALKALASYGLDSFLTVFYKEMGHAYLQPHEDGLRTLFKKIQDEIAPALRQVDAAREAIKS